MGNMSIHPSDEEIERHFAILRRIHEENEKIYGQQVEVVPQDPDAVTEAPEAPVDGKYASLRDMTFDEYVGQEDVVARLKNAINAALIEGRAMPHVAFTGPPGTGKTSLAACVAHALGRKAISVVGSEIRSLADIQSMVRAVGDGVLFIDEAHDLKRQGPDVPIESIMLTLLEDFRIGPRYVVPFTCILATTKYGELDGALQSRTGMAYQLRPYSDEDMGRIAMYHASKQNTTLDDEAASDIGRRSRSNPRFCKWLVQACRNVAVTKGEASININACIEAFAILGIDETGMSEDHRRLLSQLAQGKMSTPTCANFMDMDRRQFDSYVWPFLFRRGLILKNSSGIFLSERGKEFVQRLREGGI